MDLKNQLVTHKAFGEGKVVTHRENYLTISFKVGKKEFVFPDAFKSFLKVGDTQLASQIDVMIKEEEERARVQLEEQRRRKFEELENSIIEAKAKKDRARVKVLPRANIAFKCNLCDGDKSDERVGFAGVCSDATIKTNIQSEKRAWCSVEENPCAQYLDEKITREELDAKYQAGEFICYESNMLNDWCAYAGIASRGINKGKPMKLDQARTDSLCVLTTRERKTKEETRYIFAVFLIGEYHEGDGQAEGFVKAQENYRIELTPDQAKAMPFWKYHANKNGSDKAVWSSGLHRYFGDEQAAQILRDIADIMKGTEKEQLATELYEHFCKINRVSLIKLGEPKGALMLREQK